MEKKNIDIFISYPRASNTPNFAGEDKDHWVESFYQCLKPRFHECLGEKPTVWIDFVDLEHTGEFENRITEAIKDSRLFLVVYSKPYIHSEWCRKEFDIFKNENGPDYKKRVVIVAKQPPTESDLRTIKDPLTEAVEEIYSEIRSINYLTFYTVKNKIPIEIDPVHYGKAYKEKIIKICKSCSDAILSDDQTDVTIPEPDPIPEPVEYSEDGKVRVIIAQEIDSRALRLRREKLVKQINDEFNGEVNQVEIITPALSNGEAGEENSYSIPELHHCHIYVQIIDQYGYMCDEGESQSPENLQFEAVRDCDQIDKIIWRIRPQGDITDSDCINFEPHGEQIWEYPYAKFVQDVLDRIRSKLSKFEKNSGLKVFLDYHPRDEYSMEAVTVLRAHILNKKNVGIKNFSDEKNLASANTCKGAIVVYGDPVYQEEVSSKANVLAEKISDGRIYITKPEKPFDKRFLNEQPGGYLDIDAEMEDKLSKIDEFLEVIDT